MELLYIKTIEHNNYIHIIKMSASLLYYAILSYVRLELQKYKILATNHDTFDKYRVLNNYIELGNYNHF